jgi:cytochrome c oxidase subunit II
MTRTMKLLAGLLAIVFAPTAALAQAGRPKEWGLSLQDPVTPVAEYISWFNNYLLVIITVISLFVLGLLIYVMMRFNAKANPVPSKTTHHVGLEVAWTLIPILILLAIVVPSFRLLYMQRDIPVADLTVKVIGNPSWNWTVQYPDLGMTDTEPNVSYGMNLLPEADAKSANVPYLLATDAPIVVPVNKTVKMIVTSDPAGIIHAWTVPSFGMKIDAIPGRLNEDWFKATKEGVYYGQCSELCGTNHAFMPIEVWVVAEDKYNQWAEAQKAGDAAKVLEIQKSIKPAPQQVAAN